MANKQTKTYLLTLKKSKLQAVFQLFAENWAREILQVTMAEGNQYHLGSINHYKSNQSLDFGEYFVLGARTLYSW